MDLLGGTGPLKRRARANTKERAPLRISPLHDISSTLVRMPRNASPTQGVRQRNKTLHTRSYDPNSPNRQIRTLPNRSTLDPLQTAPSKIDIRQWLQLFKCQTVQFWASEGSQPGRQDETGQEDALDTGSAHDAIHRRRTERLLQGTSYAVWRTTRT